MTIDKMYELLSGYLDRRDLGKIAAHWRSHGVPEDAKGLIRKVQRSPRKWRALLLKESDNDSDRDRIQPARDTGPSGWSSF